MREGVEWADRVVLLAAGSTNTGCICVTVCAGRTRSRSWNTRWNSSVCDGSSMQQRREDCRVRCGGGGGLTQAVLRSCPSAQWHSRIQSQRFRVIVTSLCGVKQEDNSAELRLIHPQHNRTAEKRHASTQQHSEAVANRSQLSCAPFKGP